MSGRPRRSVLYMPGSNARALAKGRSLPADGLILDLEDAVAPSEKDNARAQVVAALAEGGYGGREILLRVNALDTPHAEADLVAAATSGAHGVLLPKVESAETVERAAWTLEQAGGPRAQRLWCMIETPRGVLEAQTIASSHPKLAGFVMGTSDLAKDLRCAHTPSREPLLTSLSLVLLAARAEGLAILDGVHLDLQDDEGLAASCRQGRELGFDGKTLIHPKQIAAANAAFAPSEAEVERARRVVAAFEEAQAAGQGVVLVDGRLVENLHVEMAKSTLAMAEALSQLDQ